MGVRNICKHTFLYSPTFWKPSLISSISSALIGVDILTPVKQKITQTLLLAAFMKRATRVEITDSCFLIPEIRIN